MPELRCARCGRRVGIYLSELGPYLAHVIPFAFHRAQLARAVTNPAVPVEEDNLTAQARKVGASNRTQSDFDVATGRPLGPEEDNR